jgi:hypothetical protein
MTNSRPFLLLSGVPGTGKSCFAHWLLDEHGLPYHDVDTRGLPSTESLQKPYLVVDWGFPATQPRLDHAINVIRCWIDAGTEYWWFDGDRDAALESFLSRNTVPKSAWNIQIRGIEENWDVISDLFDGRILQVLGPGLDYLPNAQIFKIMFPGGLPS